MILKKQERDNIIKAIYDSSNILASVYDGNNKDLTIIFKKGAQYKYPNVSAIDYILFETAESQGIVFNAHIKKYPFEKLEEMNPVELITEIENLKPKL